MRTFVVKYKYFREFRELMQKFNPGYEFTAEEFIRQNYVSVKMKRKIIRKKGRKRILRVVADTHISQYWVGENDTLPDAVSYTTYGIEE